MLDGDEEGQLDGLPGHHHVARFVATSGDLVEQAIRVRLQVGDPCCCPVLRRGRDGDSVGSPIEEVQACVGGDPIQPRAQ
jgi:hypothetical protein